MSESLASKFGFHKYRIKRLKASTYGREHNVQYWDTAGELSVRIPKEQERCWLIQWRARTPKEGVLLTGLNICTYPNKRRGLDLTMRGNRITFLAHEHYDY